MSVIASGHKCCGRLSAVWLTLCAVLGFVLPTVADSAADAVMFRKPKPAPKQQSFLLDVVPVKETKAPAPKPAPGNTNSPSKIEGVAGGRGRMTGDGIIPPRPSGALPLSQGESLWQSFPVWQLTTNDQPLTTNHQPLTTNHQPLTTNH